MSARGVTQCITTCLPYVGDTTTDEFVEEYRFVSYRSFRLVITKEKAHGIEELVGQLLRYEKVVSWFGSHLRCSYRIPAVVRTVGREEDSLDSLSWHQPTDILPRECELH